MHIALKGVVMSEKKKNKKLIFLGVLAIVVAGFSLIIAFHWAWDKSSLNDSCMSCHYHTDADISWNISQAPITTQLPTAAPSLCFYVNSS